MRKFVINQKVFIEHNKEEGIITGIIVDKRYAWLFTEYAVESEYSKKCDWESADKIPVKRHIDWISPDRLFAEN